MTKQSVLRVYCDSVAPGVREKVAQVRADFSSPCRNRGAVHRSGGVTSSQSSGRRCKGADRERVLGKSERGGQGPGGF